MSLERQLGTISPDTGNSIMAFERPLCTISHNNKRETDNSLNHNIASQMITITVKELNVPYDMIIGRKSIKEYNLLRFDTDLCQAGMNSSYSSRELTLEETAAMRRTKPHQIVSVSNKTP